MALRQAFLLVLFCCKCSILTHRRHPVSCSNWHTKFFRRHLCSYLKKVMFHARAHTHTHTHTHICSFCMCLLSARRRIFKYPFRIFASPNTKYKFILTVTLLVKSKVKVVFWGFAPCSVFLCFLRRFGGKYCLHLQDSGYWSNEVEEDASHQNHLSHPKMQATLPSETSDGTKHSVVWRKSQNIPHLKRTTVSYSVVYLKTHNIQIHLNLRCSIPKCLWNKRWEKFRQTQQW